MVFQSRSAAQTRALGKKIGGILGSGDVVALCGELGSGKTTFVKGVAQGLGIAASEVASPTFVIVHEYEGRKKVYHVDWYRLRSLGAVDAGMAREYFEGDGVTLIEWADRAPALLPVARLVVHLKHRGLNAREIRVSAKGQRHEMLIRRLAKP
ncbi:MAG: tRNA (adenosine(37)-N6)-threonylcarbamoyltransferase complex ATPase subunit type 1 TsaE [Candidatus Omnitrophica bacterium]|nr:tRNA (adenosine(37)-N6)-threonylcarbamoyltransferase complex ATPase subunit type 1 TsaE [Candidatus Omnitrophota bacterium]